MIEGLVVREARATDLDDIIALYAADEIGGHGDSLDPARRAGYEAAWRKIERSSGDTVYVAERAGRIVGTFQLVISPCLLGGGRTRAMVEAVHVDPEARGEGIGSAMMTFATDLARRAEARYLELTSNANRHGAHRFYERLGFRQSHLGFKLTLD